MEKDSRGFPETLKYVLSHNAVCGTMANITLSVPDEIRKEMKEFSEIRWSEIVRRAIIEKLETLRLAENLAKKSKLTEKDVKQFGKKIKSLAAKRFLHENSN